MGTFLLILGMAYLFLGVPISIIFTVVFLVKKKRVKIPLMCIFASFVLSFILFMTGGMISSKEKPTNITAKSTKPKVEATVKSTKQAKTTLAETTQVETTAQPPETAPEENTIEETTVAETTIEETTSDATNATIANDVYDILKNQIGFSDLEFENQLDGSSNYKIVADGHSMVVTAMDGYYRVFIPNSSKVFYEDGTVLMTAQELADTTISQDDYTTYYLIAEEIISNNLKNPRSAKFPSLITHAGDIGFAKTGDIITVQSYVDATNSFNAKIRSKWTVQFIVTDKSTYSYEVTYINIDGNKAGTYTEVK